MLNTIQEQLPIKISDKYLVRNIKVKNKEVETERLLYYKVL